MSQTYTVTGVDERLGVPNKKGVPVVEYTQALTDAQVAELRAAGFTCTEVESASEAEPTE